jgi:hypothetical protein
MKDNFGQNETVLPNQIDATTRVNGNAIVNNRGIYTYLEETFGPDQFYPGGYAGHTSTNLEKEIQNYYNHPLLIGPREINDYNT